MGSSGAGKTTLLNALADRLPKSGRKIRYKGSVQINHKLDVKQKNFGNYGAYVMQDDILFSTFTCEQALMFAARLRLNESSSKCKQRVEEVIEDLGLHHCRKTKIGNEMIKGLSGGERKRTSIGVEVITNPQILFCDEPTSGLDSFNAKKIVKLLVKLANQGKAVIATIHQPSSDTYALFDKLILLSEGYVIYQGKAKQAPDYFTSIGFVLPRYSNPADYYLKEFYIPPKKDAIVLKKLDKVVKNYDKVIRPKVNDVIEHSKTSGELDNF